MGLFNRFRSGNEKFVDEIAFENNRKKQMEMTSQVLDQLRKLNINAGKELRLEYFFYTDTFEKAKQLADEIEKLNYSVKFGPSASDKSIWVVSGWTDKIEMSDNKVSLWTAQMCDLGYKFDCEFDGWGTDPTQV